jgi:hypothetical protein
LKKKPAGKPARVSLCAHTDLTEVFDLSGVPEQRRHFYFYFLLLLYILLIHTIENFRESSADGSPQESAEVSKLIDEGAVARNLY